MSTPILPEQLRDNDRRRAALKIGYVRVVRRFALEQDDIDLAHRLDTWIADLTRRSVDVVVHWPGIRPRPKMDTPTGLFGGRCSCGWESDGLETEAGAWKSARQHSDALNELPV